MASSYLRRVVDDELDQLVEGVAALSIEGAKAVGKTFTASQRARTQYRLDDAPLRAVIEADHARLLDGERPVLIDEWQRVSPSWDLIRREVDKPETPPGSFHLRGAPSPPADASTHSGAGRIVTVRMRPMTLAERGVATPTV